MKAQDIEKAEKLAACGSDGQMNEVNEPKAQLEAVPLDYRVSGPATPKAHQKHANGVPCGCWTGTGSSISCRCCGASYELAEVQSFLNWRCYDCGASVCWRNAERLPANAVINGAQWV